MIIFVILGTISAIFQLAVLREFTFSIAKNELSFVAGAGVWLVCCSLGSLSAKKIRFRRLEYLALIWTIAFCLAAAGIHLAKSLGGFNYYETVSLCFIAISGLILIGPVSFLTGFSFSLFSRQYLDSRPISAGTFARFFIYEAIGFFSGGMLFAFFLSGYRNPFIFAFLPLLFFAALGSENSKKIFPAAVIIILSLASVLGFKFILRQEFQGATIVRDSGSPYGPVILARQSGVESLYANGSLVSSSEDTAWNEEFIHTALSAVNNPKQVLFIGPYYSGQINQILKHPVVSLECLDINPVLLSLNRPKLLELKDSRVAFRVDDPRLYLRQSARKYDCIIMNIPAPANLAFNRYFTREFFSLVKKHLNPEGVFCFYIPAKRDILSPHIRQFDSCIINTVDQTFRNRFLVPGDSMLVIAGESGPILEENLIEHFLTRRIKTVYFTPYHLRDALDPGRRQYLESRLDKTTGINSDFYPRGFLYYLILEQVKFYPDIPVDIQPFKTILTTAIITLLVLIFFLTRRNKRRSVLVEMGGVGFASIGSSAVILIIFQVYSGALFWKAGILVGVFMLGLAAASGLLNSKIGTRPLGGQNLKVFFWGWILFIGSLIAGIRILPGIFYGDLTFYLYSFIAGALTGMAYPVFSRLAWAGGYSPTSIPVTLYAADLVGAFWGTLTFSVLFIPFMGIYASLLILLSVMLVFTLTSCAPRRCK